MTGTSENYSGRNEAHVANRYWTRVKEGNSKVDIGHTQEMGVESKVEVNAMLDHDSFVIRTEYLLEQVLSALYIRRTGLIIFQYQFVSLVLPVMRNVHSMAYVSVLARYKLHDFFRCHNVYSKKVATISHLNLMRAISYLLSYFQKDTILFIVTIIVCPETILKIKAAIKIVTISTREILVFLHFYSMVIMLVSEFDF